ncbi:MAG: hypothetical protein FJ264_02795 [Planctomycetes bacterium]|nr:hypothetical protein [Planctomycetota bacterium]
MKHHFGIALLLLFTLLFGFGCKEKNNSSSASPDLPDLAGIWILVKENVIGYDIEDGKRKDWNETNVLDEEIFQFNANNVKWYTKEETCYEVDDTITYKISGKRLIGPFWEGTDSEEKNTTTWSTSIEYKNNYLVITRAENIKEPRYESYEKIIQYFKKYTGTLPPSGWPKQMCQ